MCIRDSHRDPIVLTDLYQVHPCDAGKDVVVVGMSLENAVLDDGNIAVSTFRNHVSTMEYAFSAAHGPVSYTHLDL